MDLSADAGMGGLASFASLRYAISYPCARHGSMRVVSLGRVILRVLARGPWTEWRLSMTGRYVALYFAWSRPDEVAAPLGILEDRFPALFEVRRMSWPRFEQFADPAKFDQGIGGFLDHIQLTNFTHLADLAAKWTGNPVRLAERRTDASLCPLDREFLAGIDTLIVISFDSPRTHQQASDAEIRAIAAFLDDPDHTLFVCPHHDIGDVDGLPEVERLARQELEFHHHGDPGIPARQSFGDFGLSLLNGLGLSVRNRYGLRPAKL